MRSRRVTVVLPVFNEEEALTQLLPQLAGLAPVGIVAVDDGSRDGSAGVLGDFAHPEVAITVLTHEVNRGLGRTIRDGLYHVAGTAEAGDIIVTMDADNTHPVDRIPLMAEFIDNGADIVVASRYQRGSKVVGLTWLRRFLSYGANMLFRVAAPIPGLKDYTCGYRAVRAGLLQEAIRAGVDLVTETGFASTAEIVLKLRRFRPICREVPLVLRYDRKPTQSKMRVAKTIGDLLRMLWSSRGWAAAPGDQGKSQPTGGADGR